MSIYTAIVVKHDFFNLATWYHVFACKCVFDFPSNVIFKKRTFLIRLQ